MVVFVALRRIGAAIGAIIVTASLLTFSPSVAVAAPALPAGFVLTDHDSGQGAYNLTDFTYLPDDSVLTTGKGGTVTWLKPGETGPRRIATMSAYTERDSGLLSIAVPPDYQTTRSVYTTRAVPLDSGFVWRLSRWKATGTAEPTGLANERPVLEIPGNSAIHGMWNIEFDDDGTLWVSMGDSADTYVDPLALRALDLDEPYGKLLRINPDGTALPSNPFYEQDNPNSVRSKVYASGFRSPFRFNFDPRSGAPLLGDVGWNSREEIDLVRAGQNYKWPCWEGDRQSVGYPAKPECANVLNTPPLWSYPRTSGNSVTGGIVYEGDSYPAAYRGAYFFGDYATNKLWTLTFDSEGNLTRAPEPGGFGTGIGGPVSFDAAPNGDVVYADITSGKLRRLSYAPGNKAPVAQFTTVTDPTTRTVTFDGSSSYDFDNEPLTYVWDFGDGTTATGPQVEHTYPDTAEEFTATLRVRDPLGAVNTSAVTVRPADHTPTVTVNPTDSDGRFAVGEPISITATADDPEDGALDIAWTSREVHCPAVGACHAHPGPTSSADTFTASFTGHPDTRMEIIATATDSAGNQGRVTYTAWPRQHRLTLTSTVSAQLAVGDTGTGSTLVTAGMKVLIEAAPSALDGVATFERWNDGVGERSRTIVMPDEPLTVSATYLTPIDRRYDSEPGLREVIGSPTGPEIADGDIRYRNHESGRLYWTAATGVHEMHGGILTSFDGLGGHGMLGVPTTDELPTPDGKGRYNDLTGRDGLPASMYWTPETGAHGIWGRIREEWVALGAEQGPLGYPTTSEKPTPDGKGRYNDFAGVDGPASIYWTSKTGAHGVWGAIRREWIALDAEQGPLGYPTTSEKPTPDGKGRYNDFAGVDGPASIYWTSKTGAHGVWGAIRRKWVALGAERGVLGYPTTSEKPTPDRAGRYNHFTGQDGPASIYWTSGTGAWEVYGAIRRRWSALGWERSYLGYPTTGEFAIPGGRRNNFQRGYIAHDFSSSTTTDRRY
jgi:glucose/arabinose dehydrogenase